MSMKGHILAGLREQFKQWDGTFAALSGKQVLAKSVEDGWTIKDLVVHLWGWQQVSIARMRTGIDEHPPVFPDWINTLSGDWEDAADQTNTWLLDRFRKKPWKETYQDWREGYLEMMALGESISELVLLDSGRYPWLRGYSLAFVLVGSYNHHQEHLETLLEWRGTKSAGQSGKIHVRPFDPEDEAFIRSLAPRLAIGRQSWRDLDLWLAAVDVWLTESLAQHNQKTKVFIAENEEGQRLGFATVSHSKHFSGQSQATIGELMTSESAEGGAVGSALVQSCEQWSREQGYRYLTVSTGAGNPPALRFYHNLGFQDEDVTLTKPLYLGSICASH